MVQCLQYVLIRSDDHDVWATVEFIAASHRMRRVRYLEAGLKFTDLYGRVSLYRVSWVVG